MTSVQDTEGGLICLITRHATSFPRSTVPSRKLETKLRGVGHKVPKVNTKVPRVGHESPRVNPKVQEVVRVGGKDGWCGGVGHRVRMRGVTGIGWNANPKEIRRFPEQVGERGEGVEMGGSIRDIRRRWIRLEGFGNGQGPVGMNLGGGRRYRRPPGEVQGTRKPNG